MKAWSADVDDASLGVAVGTNVGMSVVVCLWEVVRKVVVGLLVAVVALVVLGAGLVVVSMMLLVVRSWARQRGLHCWGCQWCYGRGNRRCPLLQEGGEAGEPLSGGLPCCGCRLRGYPGGRCGCRRERRYRRRCCVWQ